MNGLLFSQFHCVELRNFSQLHCVQLRDFILRIKDISQQWNEKSPVLYQFFD